MSRDQGLNLDYLVDHPHHVLELTWDHFTLSLTAMLLGLIFAIPLGIIGARVPRFGVVLLGILGAVYTIPSIAFLGLLIPWLGLGSDNATVVLGAYSLTFLVRNIIIGLRGVDPTVIEAARGMGLTAWQVFLRVTVPLALPVIVAGIRTAFVAVISIATVAGWIGASGLGRLLFDGIRLRRPSMILAGAVAITLLAVVVDIVIRWLARYLPANRARRATA